MTTILPVVLAGGSGTRLWPMSRHLYPKQFLELFDTYSVYQETLGRVAMLEDAVPPLVVCNEEHRFIALEQSAPVLRPQALLLESEGKNTAPAATIAALCLLHQDPAAAQGVMLILPSDNMIADQARFRAVVQAGATVAASGSLVTFGIRPTHPATGYGYIEASDVLAGEPTPCPVRSFKEKPDRSTAEGFLATGRHLWNSGMFMVSPSRWLELIQAFRPDIHEVCRRAFETAGRDAEFVRPSPSVFNGCPADSIDYAVVERLAAQGNGQDAGKGVMVLPLDAGWSDAGSWSAIWEAYPNRNEDGNLVRGDTITLSTTGSLVVAQHRLLATVGIEDAVVVETPDAVLVTSKDRAEDVRQLTALLQEQDRPEYENHRRVYRPWGAYETVDAGPRFQVKRLTVNPGAALSLQMHHHRAEHWVVARGTARVTRGDEEFLLTEDQSTYIPVGTAHRLENPGSIPLEIIEVQSGSYLGEDDIVRYEDRYNRHVGG